MIKKFENFNDLDPYGEEDWDEPKLFKKGDIVTCINYSDKSIQFFKIGRKYEVIKVYDYDYYNDEQRLELKDLVTSYKVGGGVWKSFRFRKVDNEVLENINSDIDPYGEEDWDDKQLQSGDDVICIKDRRPSFIKGKIYKTHYVSDRFILVKTKIDINVPFFDRGQFDEYFKKVKRHD